MGDVLSGVIPSANLLSGKIGGGTLTPTVKITGVVGKNYQPITGVVTGRAPIDQYTGDYIVTPRADEQQELETARKYMNADVVVLEIPYSEVSNLSGGITAKIG